MLKRSSAIVLISSVVGACVPYHPAWLVAPAHPGVPVRAPGYAPVTAGVRGYAVVEPKDWIEQNRQVAPADGRQDRGNDAAAAARRGR